MYKFNGEIVYETIKNNKSLQTVTALTLTRESRFQVFGHASICRQAGAGTASLHSDLQTDTKRHLVKCQQRGSWTAHAMATLTKHSDTA